MKKIKKRVYGIFMKNMKLSFNMKLFNSTHKINTQIFRYLIGIIKVLKMIKRYNCIWIMFLMLYVLVIKSFLIMCKIGLLILYKIQERRIKVLWFYKVNKEQVKTCLQIEYVNFLDICLVYQILPV